jgi:hypothetical protein
MPIFIRSRSDVERLHLEAGTRLLQLCPAYTDKEVSLANHSPIIETV